MRLASFLALLYSISVSLLPTSFQVLYNSFFLLTAACTSSSHHQVSLSTLDPPTLAIPNTSSPHTLILLATLFHISLTLPTHSHSTFSSTALLNSSSLFLRAHHLITLSPLNLPAGLEALTLISNTASLCG